MILFKKLNHICGIFLIINFITAVTKCHTSANFSTDSTSSSSIASNQINYSGYKVFRLSPKNNGEIETIKELKSLGLSFWQESHKLNQPSDILFPPHLQGDLIDSLKNSGLDIQEIIPDIQNRIENEVIQESSLARAQFDFAQYHSLADIYEYLDNIASKYSTIAKTFSIGSSYNGLDLKVIKISKSGETKPAIWLDSNIHAREWITSAVCLFTINQLLTSNDPTIQSLTEKYDWYILPILNPDGFKYSQTVDRFWRKTRSKTSSILCKGVDPNRNWGYHWNDGGSSDKPCDETYGGPYAFSEPENKAASVFQKNLGDRLKCVLSLHSYSQYILIPYGVRVPFPQHDEYMRIGKLVAAAISKRYGTQFTPGNIVDLLYVASGGSTDWAKGTLSNVLLTYTFELRDTGRNGFLLPADQIIPSANEFLDGLIVLIEELDGLLTRKDESVAKD